MATTTRILRPSPRCLRALRHTARRSYSTPSTPTTSPFAPRHLMSIADLTPQELTRLILNASSHKAAIKSGNVPANLKDSLLGKTIAMMFTKRSTRTRVSTEAAVAQMGGHPMFLGSQDIQLGVNESLYDTSVVISSMVSAIVARVNAHSDVADLAKHSSVPVINALSDLYHPLQTIADFLTIHEASPARNTHSHATSASSLGLEGLKIAWVGDANNVLFDLAIGAAKLGVHISVATPKGYEIPKFMEDIITSSSPTHSASNPSLTTTNIPYEAVKNADIIVTDTWISMGQEAESQKRIKDFEGFQVTQELAKKGGAKEGWKFMHCLPRHPEEVSDEVFYGPASLVFQEAENRLWAAVAALEGFVVNKGKIV
jgi:ornithine carbamoyltransferase